MKVPQLRDVTQFYVVNTGITMIVWVFSHIYVITRGPPANSTKVLQFYIYNSAFRYNLFGSASAVAAILFIITMLLASLPKFVLYLFGQRYFIRGLRAGAVEG